MTIDPRFEVENVKRLTEMHIRRYEERVIIGKDPRAPGHKLINLDQCEAYLALWKGIEAKGYDWAKMDTDEKNEVIDAIQDEE